MTDQPVQPVEDTPAEPQPPRLLADLRAAAVASHSETPQIGEIPGLFGTLLAVLEHEGLKVAEDFLPQPVEAVAAPAVHAAAQAASPELHNLLVDLVNKVEGLAAKVEGQSSQASSSEEPAAGTAGDAGSAPPLAGPAEPPLEGAQ
jgi:hypothetical protein